MSENTKSSKLNSELFDEQSFEERLKKQSEEREKAREEYYRKKAERLGQEQVKKPNQKIKAGDAAVYKAKTALNTQKERSVRAEGFIHRTARLFKGLSAVRKQLRNEPNYTAEDKRRMRMDVVRDAYQPLTDGITEFEVNMWDFLTLLWGDVEDILLFVADLFIAAGYYLGSICLFIWDYLWDFRLWLDENKRALFQVFSAGLAAMAVIVIAISSITGYEYSYYGRILGITRSKQEVYSTIDALGDKLAEATGANISLDVERDIEFKKIYGFKLNIDDKDDILNTLTYMKDIQVRAFAVSVDGKQAVIVENEEVAQNLIKSITDFFTPAADNKTYTEINVENVITIDEVGAVLGDIWNPKDAFNFMLTGSSKKNPADGELKSLINVSATLLESYTQDNPFKTRYIDDSSMYEDETTLISAGVPGKTEVVEKVTLFNGEELSRETESKNKISNPVEAVYYKGTKPLPERAGTGTFEWPLKPGTYYTSSGYGSRNTGIVGASTYHLGLDLAAPSGTKIYASDGGVVTFAGWRSSYGYVVIIDHGGLYETRYAHCSKLVVSKGDKVYQGQHIANVGSTGISSGPHCHWEILYKGDHLNPAKVMAQQEKNKNDE